MRYILLIFMITLNVFANEADNKFTEANRLYNEGNYEQAVQIYQDIVNNGYNESKVFYNLGNSFYKLEMIPQAILNYERALKADPDNEDAEFNLRLANVKTIDKIEEVPKVFYVQWYNDLLNSFSSTGLSLASTFFIWGALVLFVLFVIVNNSGIKKITFALGILSIIIFISTTIFAVNDYNIEQHQKDAIIFSQSVYVKSSPDDAGTNLFMLHEGTKVEILDEVNQWKKVKIKNGNIGWIEPGSVEVI